MGLVPHAVTTPRVFSDTTVDRPDLKPVYHLLSSSHVYWAADVVFVATVASVAADIR